jgi:hypothetical protein
VITISSRSLPSAAKHDTSTAERDTRRNGARVRLYVTTTQAAKELGVGVRSLQRWVKAGLIEPDYLTPGGHMRWDVDRVRAELRAELRRRRAE